MSFRHIHTHTCTRTKSGWKIDACLISDFLILDMCVCECVYALVCVCVCTRWVQKLEDGQYHRSRRPEWPLIQRRREKQSRHFTKHGAHITAFMGLLRLRWNKTPNTIERTQIVHWIPFFTHSSKCNSVFQHNLDFNSDEVVYQSLTCSHRTYTSVLQSVSFQFTCRTVKRKETNAAVSVSLPLYKRGINCL